MKYSTSHGFLSHDVVVVVVVMGVVGVVNTAGIIFLQVTRWTPEVFAEFPSTDEGTTTTQQKMRDALHRW
jgi:hypothetical protein